MAGGRFADELRPFGVPTVVKSTAAAPAAGLRREQSADARTDATERFCTVASVAEFLVRSHDTCYAKMETNRPRAVFSQSEHSEARGPHGGYEPGLCRRGGTS